MMWSSIAGVVVFLTSWTYCALEYGFLFGFGLGWIPSGILGGIAFVIVAYKLANRG